MIMMIESKLANNCNDDNNNVKMIYQHYHHGTRLKCRSKSEQRKFSNMIIYNHQNEKSNIILNFTSFIHLVSIFSLINLVVIGGQKISHDSNHYHQITSNENSESNNNNNNNNRFYFKNGTAFHFGGQNHHHSTHPSSSSSSSNVINNDSFKTRPITGSVIHVSDAINVNDRSDSDQDYSRTQTHSSNYHHPKDQRYYIHHHPLHNQIDHIDRGSILHRQLNANYNVQEGRGFNINQFNRSAHDDRRLITSAHQGGRTDLESYHRAAAIPYDNSAVIVSSDNAGELHSTGGNFYRGTITDVTDSFGDNRAILGSANAGYGRLHLSGTQASHNLHNVNAHHGLINRTQIGAIDRNIVHTGAPYTIDSGHQNRIQTGAINRTFVHSGTGPNVYATGHRHNQTGSLNAVNRTIGYGGQTIPIHSGYQPGGVNVRPINHTAIYSGSHIYSSNHTGTGATVNQTHGPITYSGPNTRINTISDSSSSNRIIDDVRNNRLQSQPSSVIGSSSDNTRSSNINENINDNNINGQTLRFNNNVKPSSSSTAQSSGTAIVSLNSLDNVEIEAINKARIYAEHESEENAKKHALNVVRLAATDQLESEIITNRTRAYLSCESGEMIVKINFTEPFRGVGYADYDRTSPCKFYGDGGRYYEMRLPLKGCGTKQEAPRIFINNIILRFHRALELEEDEIKTIVCRYPPPLAPPPPLIAAPILEQPPPAAPFLPAKLSEVELLLIVSALLFLTLLLLGIGIGYYCLKKRKVKVVRKFVPPAEIPYFPPPSISSEEHSIISEGSVIHRDDYQFQNLGYIPEAKLSYLDDMFYNDQDMVEGDVVQTQQNIMVPPVINRFTKKYDDQFVTNASETEIDTDYEVDRLIVPKKPKITKLVTDKYFVTPKTETEIIDEVTTQRFIVPPKKPITTRYVDDTMITPYSDLEIDEMTTNERIYGPKKPISTQKVDDTYIHSQQETDIIDDVDKYRITSPKKQPHVKNTDDYYRTDLYEIDEVIDDFDQTISNAIKPTTHVSSEDDLYITHSRDVEEFVDDTTHRVMKTTKTPQKPIEPPRKPKITVKNIDDFYITNITETETNEQITKIGRSMPNLTLEIDYEEEIEQEQERMIEETSRLTGFDVKLRSIPRKPTKPTTTTTTTKSTSETISKTKIDEIVRILDNPPRERIPNIDEHFMLPTRNRFRQIIMTDEVFRTLIIESTTTEEYVERIQCHPKYGPMFEPPTWSVIFRILALPEVSQIRPVRPTRYSDTYRSGYSAQEVRSVTEEDVIFTRNRMSGAHFTPLPDYPMDDDEQSLKSGDWNKRLPDPKRYECHSPDFQPIKSAFSIKRRTGSGRRSRPSGTISPISTSSSVFGTRRLENPYTTTTPTTTTITPTTRRGLYEYDFRPYSPDLDALSLEPSQSYLAYSGSIRHRNNQLYHHHQQQQATLEEREEIKSTTETNVYDWKRYS